MRLRPAHLPAALLLLAAALACNPKHYVLLSPDDDYSDDPALVVKVARIEEATTGRTEVTLAIENKRSDAISLAEATATLVDADEKPQALLAKPNGELRPGETRVVAFAFDTAAAAKGSLELKLALPGSKISSIVFSAEKPPDFKPTPEQGPQGGPPGLGGPGGGGPYPR